jgi:hypothetical protein
MGAACGGLCAGPSVPIPSLITSTDALRWCAVRLHGLCVSGDFPVRRQTLNAYKARKANPRTIRA